MLQNKSFELLEIKKKKLPNIYDFFIYHIKQNMENF